MDTRQNEIIENIVDLAELQTLQSNLPYLYFSQFSDYFVSTYTVIRHTVEKWFKNYYMYNKAMDTTSNYSPQKTLLNGSS